MVDVSKTGNSQEVQKTATGTRKARVADKVATDVAPVAADVVDKSHHWNPKVTFKDNSFDVYNLTSVEAGRQRVGLRDFFKQDDVPHNVSIRRVAVGPATNDKFQPLKHGNVSQYGSKWDPKKSTSVDFVNNDATFKDLKDAIKKGEQGNLIRQDFVVEFNVHHGAAKKGVVEKVSVPMSTFAEEWSGQIRYTLDHMKPNCEGLWARLRQEIIENGGKIAKSVKVKF